MPITVPGAPTAVTVTGSDVLDLATHIRDALVYAQTELNTGGLGVTTVDATGQPLPDPADTVGTQELVLFATDTVNATVPAGYDCVVVTGSSPVTLTGIHGSAILADEVGGVFSADGNAGIASIAAVSGANTITASGQYVISLVLGAEDQFVSVDGSGTIAAGPGSTSISAAGQNNLILAGVGDTTVDSSGYNNSIFGSFNGTAGKLTASVSGDDAVLSIGDDHATVTAAGSYGFFQGGNPGSTLQVVDLGSHNVFNALSSNESATLAGSGAFFQGGTAGTTITVVDNGTNNIFNALSSDISATLTGSGAYFQGGTADATLTIVDNGTNNIFNALSSDVFATLTGSGAYFQGGAAGTTMTIVDEGSGNVFNALSSNESATLAGSGAYFQGGTANSTITVVDNGTNDTINALDSNMAVSVSGGSGLFIGGGSGTLEFVGGESVSTIWGGVGGSAMTVGAGGVIFAANGTSNQVTGAAGSTSTIFGSSDPSAVTFSGAGDLIYSASTGNVTLLAAAATGNIRAWLPGSGTGADSVQTGSGNDTITAGAGSDTLNAGSGTNLFLFVAGHTAGATDYITDTADAIANDTFSFNNYGEAPTSAVTANGVTLTLSDGTIVTFTNLTQTSQLDGHINVYNAPG